MRAPQFCWKWRKVPKVIQKQTYDGFFMDITTLPPSPHPNKKRTKIEIETCPSNTRSDQDNNIKMTKGLTHVKLVGLQKPSVRASLPLLTSTTPL